MDGRELLDIFRRLPEETQEKIMEQAIMEEAPFYAPETVETAWHILRESNPDVILLDWVMEGMSGLDLIQMIRTNPQTPNPFVPVIMLTGHTHIDQVRQARDAGINEFLAKPVSVKAVMTRLTSVIEHPRPYVRTKAYFGPCRRRRVDEYRGAERRANKDSAKAAE